MSVVLLILIAFQALVCVVLKDRNVHLRSSLDRAYDVEKGLRCQLSSRHSEISQLRPMLSSVQGDIDRLRVSLLDAQCRLEMIDDEVGFWVDDKMNVRWGVHPSPTSDCCLSSELVEEGAVDCA